jgi:hypothetical protein
MVLRILSVIQGTTVLYLRENKSVDRPARHPYLIGGLELRVWGVGFGVTSEGFEG